MTSRICIALLREIQRKRLQGVTSSRALKNVHRLSFSQADGHARRHDAPASTSSGTVADVFNDQNQAYTTLKSDQQHEESSESILPPLNGLETQVFDSSQRHLVRSDFSWKKLSYQCLKDGSNIPQHVVIECLKSWTRLRPIRRSSTSITWKLLDVIKTDFERQGDKAEFSSHRAILINVLDHWRLAIQNNVPVPLTVKEALEKVQEWERLSHTLGDVEEAVQKPYSILLKALANCQENMDLVEPILQSMPVKPSTVTVNGALTVYAKANHAEAYDRARKVLLSMDQPNEISYACLLEALYNRGHAVDEASVILGEMKERGIFLNSVCYLQYLRILTSSNQTERAREILFELIDNYRARWDKDMQESSDADLTAVVPTKHLFSAVMSAYARRGDSEQVKQLLHELQSLYASTPCEQDKELLLPTAASLNSVLEAYAKKRTMDGALEAAAILKRLEEWAARQEVAACMPDTTSYNTVLDSWAEVARFFPGAVREAEVLLERLMDNSYARPDAYSFTTVMKAWSRSNRLEAPERCQAFLDAMWGIYERERRSNVKPNDVTYATAIYAWSRVADKISAAPYRAEALYRDMKHRFQDGDRTLEPTETIYLSLITTWNRSITPQSKQQALKRANYYFDQMQARYMAGDESMRPTTKVYNALLEGMKKAGDGPGAERIFKRMMDDYERHNNKQAKPNSYTFHSIITAWARSKSPMSPLRAEALLKQMEDFHERLGWDCRPSAVSFSSVLNCWAACGRDEAPARAEAILRHMERMSEGGRSDIRPSAYSYATVLDCWARSSLEDAPERAQALFDELQNRYMLGEACCRPSAAAYLALLSTWGRSARPEGALKALATLNEMQEKHRLDDRNERPDCFHFSAVINAFAERGDEENAGALLQRIVHSDEIQPHAACYNGYIKAIIRSGCANTGEKAENVLRSMQDANCQVRPDVVTYTSCISAWENSHCSEAVHRAHSLLQECIAKSGNRRAAPSASTFLAFLRVLSRSDLREKGVLAQWSEEQMLSLGIRPTRSIRLELEKCN